MAVPVVTSITPTHGVENTFVQLHGTGFTGATSVEFNGFPSGFAVIVLSDILVTSAAPPPGAVAGSPIFVTITTPDGTSAETVDAVWEYDPLPDPPIVTAVTPASGSWYGGTAITISGLNFTGANAVFFTDGLDNYYMLSYVVENDTQITAVTGEYTPHVEQIVNTIVNTAGGNNFDTISSDDAFEYVEGPPPDEPGDPLEPCILLSVMNPVTFVADTVTADVDGTCYTVQSIDGWFDSPPVRSGTMEADVSGTRGEAVVVARELARTIEAVIVAHTLDRQTALTAPFCFAAIETVKAAFRLVFVPVYMNVTDPSGQTRTALVRRVGPIKATILGESAAVRFSIPLLAENPVLVII